MASEITDDSAPVPERSTSTILLGGSGSGPAEGFMQMLHQIQETLMDINKTLKAEKNLVTVESSASQSCHKNEAGGASEGIASSIYYQVGTTHGCHGRVRGIGGYIVDVMQAYEFPRFGGTPSPLRDFIYMVDRFGLAASDMAVIIGNGKVLEHFNKVGAFSRKDEGIPHSAESQEWVDERRCLLGPILNQPLYPFSSTMWIDDLHLTRDYEYCLHQAAKPGCWRFVKHVCESGDSSVLEPLLRFRDAQGRTPLHVGLSELHYSFKHFLKDFLEPLTTRIPSFDLNVTDYKGRTPLHYAAARGLSGVVACLAAQRKTNLNATFDSVYYCHGPEVENPKVTYLPVQNVTVLHLAVIHNHVEVVEALLGVTRDGSSQLNVNAVCDHVQDSVNYSNLWTPFQLAAYLGHERILQVLLKDDRLLGLGIKKTNYKHIIMKFQHYILQHLNSIL